MQVATPLSSTSLANIATGQTCVSLTAGRGLAVDGGQVGATTLTQRRLASAPFVQAVFGVAVEVPIPSGEQAPSDPSTTTQVKSVLTALSPLTNSPTSNVTSAVVSPLVFAALSTNGSSVTITTSSPSVTYASLPSGTTIAKSSATGGSSGISTGVVIGAAIGGIVGCAVLVGVVIWVVVLQRRKSVLQSSGQTMSDAKHSTSNPMLGK